MSRADASAQVQAWVEAGHAIPLQANVKAGHITYEFLGGTYDGVKFRVYPPFSKTMRLPEVYILSGPKNGRSARLTYRLEES